MTTVNQTTISQFSAIAPKVVTYKGRKFTPKHVVTDSETSTVTFGYVARKRRGAFIGDKIAVEVQYDAVADLYDLTVTFCNGETLDNTVIGQFMGATFDAFRDIQLFLRG